MSTTPAKKVRARRPAVSEEQIIEIATRMFSEMGFPAISIRDIATACNVNIPSIYHYFADKTDLYDRCCEHAFSRISATLRTTLTGPETAHAHIKRFTTELSEVLLKDNEFRRLLQRELLFSRSKRFEHITTQYFTAEYKTLIKALTEIEGSTGARARAQAFSIYAMVFGMIVLRPTGEIGGARLAMLDNPKKLALFVLESLFPAHDWKAV
jgi:AcrR family transcriptional regulator